MHLALLHVTALTSPTCLDRSGSPVDWFLMLKMPACSTHSPPYENLCKSGDAEMGNYTKGYKFFYADTNSPTLALEPTGTMECSKTTGVCPAATGNTTSPFVHTVKQMYGGANSVSSLSYNDQPANGRSAADTYYAHAKGMLAFDNKEGFWIVHSTPSTPSPDYASYYDESPNAQHVLCVSLSTSTIGESVVPLLRMNNVFIDTSAGDPHVTSSFQDKYPDITPLADQPTAPHHERTPTTAPYNGSYLTRQLTTSGGMQLTGVAKKGCNPDLANVSAACDDYSGIPNIFTEVLTDVLGGSLDIQTWCGGVSPPAADACLRSNCTRRGRDVYNTLQVRLGADFFWGTEIDHSKWAITTEGSTVCFGDINYSDVQRKRGGGFVCFESSALHGALKGAVDKGQTDPCPRS